VVLAALVHGIVTKRVSARLIHHGLLGWASSITFTLLFQGEKKKKKKRKGTELNKK
jgi:hypothetical protein